MFAGPSGSYLSVVSCGRPVLADASEASPTEQLEADGIQHEVGPKEHGAHAMVESFRSTQLKL